jgi:hypothetical protein
MKLIQLSQGKCAKVDDDVFDLIKGFKWTATRGHKTFYAVRGEAVAPYKRRLIQMHRQILGAPPFPRAEVDHINGDGLDNQKANLRWCTHAENRRNEPKRKTKSISRFKGVFYRPKLKKKRWMAQIKVQGRALFLGHFLTEEEAAEAYNKAALIYFREHARLNVL